MTKPAPSVAFRSATLNDLALLKYWDAQPHVIASGADDEWDWELELQRHPAWRELLIAEVEGKAIGFMQIIDPAQEDSHYWGEVESNLRALDIWIGEKENLGKGWGTQMMNLALQRCFSDPKVTAVLIDPLVSNTKAHQFYEKIGFEFVENRYFAEDYCRVYQLNRQKWAALK